MNLEEALEGKEIPSDIRATLTVVDLKFCDFNAVARIGQMVLHRDLADEVSAIFEEIAASGFPIEKMQPVVAYDWSDDASMAANNSSAFNYRFAVGKTSLSLHAYGRAIDINPVQNPYIKSELVLPPDAVYDPSMRGTLLADGPVVAAFERRGWTWGGRWTTLKDWHHFEKPELPPTTNGRQKSHHNSRGNGIARFLDRLRATASVHSMYFTPSVKVV